MLLKFEKWGRVSTNIFVLTTVCKCVCVCEESLILLDCYATQKLKEKWRNGLRHMHRATAILLPNLSHAQLKLRIFNVLINCIYC